MTLLRKHGWIPAFAGMTVPGKVVGLLFCHPERSEGSLERYRMLEKILR